MPSRSAVEACGAPENAAAICDRAAVVRAASEGESCLHRAFVFAVWEVRGQLFDQSTGQVPGHGTPCVRLSPHATRSAPHTAQAYVTVTTAMLSATRSTTLQRSSPSQAPVRSLRVRRAAPDGAGGQKQPRAQAGPSHCRRGSPALITCMHAPPMQQGSFSGQCTSPPMAGSAAPSRRSRTDPEELSTGRGRRAQPRASGMQ